MKSQFFPGGRNCKLLLIFSLVTIISVQASALIITEDFENVTTASTTFTTDGILQHTIYDGSMQPATNDLWDISTYNPNGPSFADNALNLWLAQDVVTFNLAPGLYVDFASVKVINWGSFGNLSMIIFKDVNGEIHQDFITVQDQWLTYDTSALGLGNLQSITLYSQEGAFDDLEVNVVPEPMTLSLLGLGSVILRRRKRK